MSQTTPTTTTTTTTKSSRPPTRVTHAPGSEYQSQTSTMLSSAFSTDPLFAWMLNNIPKEDRLEVRKLLFDVIFTAATLSGNDYYRASTYTPPQPPSSTHSTSRSDQDTGKFQEDENIKDGKDVYKPEFQCAAILSPPSTSRVDVLPATAWLKILTSGLIPLVFRIGISQTIRLFSYPRTAEKIKNSFFREGEKYYYIFIVGTDEAHRGKGLCASLVRDVQGRAGGEGLPIYLEATTEASRGVYAKLGFVDVEGSELVFGKGDVGADGEIVNGEGERGGVRCWPMIWWPAGYVRPSVEGKKGK